MMKTIYLLSTLAALFFFMPGTGQTISEKEVPVSVVSAFSSLHPGISPVWTKERWGYYEASFSDSLKMKAVFNANGLLQRQLSLMKNSDIPAKVREHATGLLEGYKPAEAWLVSTPDEKSFYLLLMQKGKDIRYLTYGPDFQYMGENYFDEQKNRK